MAFRKYRFDRLNFEKDQHSVLQTAAEMNFGYLWLDMYVDSYPKKPIKLSTFKSLHLLNFHRPQLSLDRRDAQTKKHHVGIRYWVGRDA